MLKELQPENEWDDDWGEAFKFAQSEHVSTFPGSKTPIHGFTREDVAEVFGKKEGQNDGDPWRCWGRLNDGRFFYLEAGCDYTGWDCQADGSTAVASTKEECWKMCLTDEARQIFGVLSMPT